jgi:hypothetical protein
MFSTPILISSKGLTMEVTHYIIVHFQTPQPDLMDQFRSIQPFLLTFVGVLLGLLYNDEYFRQLI